MAKLTLADIGNLLGNPTSAATSINNNNTLLEAALENTLSRNGATPNQMNADIDLNNNDLLNVKLIDVDELIVKDTNITALVELAEVSAEVAVGAAESAELSEIAAELAQDAAEDAKDLAVAAAGANLANVGTEEIAKTLSFPPLVTYVRTAGKLTVGDGGAALYAPIASPPILGFQDLNHLYWELKEDEILPEMAGVRSNNTSVSAQNKINFQKAADTGHIIKIPAKAYYTDPGIVIEGGGIVGTSRFKSQIVTQDITGANLITGYGNDGLLFENVYYVATDLAKVGGSAIYLTSPTSANLNTHIERNIFAQFPQCITAQRALAYNISNNIFSQYDIALTYENQDQPDGGDSCLTNNLFVTNRATPNKIAVLQYNSGGLKIVGNKFNGGNYGYLMQAKGSASLPTQSTSILIINSNSFEHQANGAIVLSRAGTADSSIRFLHAIISSNMINGQPISGSAATNVVSIDANLNLKWLVFSANTVQVSSGGGVGLTIGAVDQGMVSGNVFGTGGVNVGTGISTGTNAFCRIGPNEYELYSGSGTGLLSERAIANATNTQIIAGG